MSRVQIVLLIVAAMALTLGAPSLAQAAHVTSKKAWAAGNEYLAQADLDGRTRPSLNATAKTNWVRKGQWVQIQCQVDGELAYGSRIWDKVGAYFVPDHFIKTYTDGFISGSPRCDVRAAPANPPCGPADRDAAAAGRRSDRAGSATRAGPLGRRL